MASLSAVALPGADVLQLPRVSRCLIRACGVGINARTGSRITHTNGTHQRPDLIPLFVSESTNNLTLFVCLLE